MPSWNTVAQLILGGKGKVAGGKGSGKYNTGVAKGKGKNGRPSSNAWNSTPTGYGDAWDWWGGVPSPGAWHSRKGTGKGKGKSGHVVDSGVGRNPHQDDADEGAGVRQPWVCGNTECNLIHDNAAKQSCRSCGTKRPKVVGEAAVAIPTTLLAGPAVKILHRWGPHIKENAGEAGGPIRLDAGDDDADEYHGRKTWYEASIAEAKTRGENATAKCFEEQLKALKPPDLAQAAKDTRLLSQKLLALKAKTEQQTKKLEAIAIQAGEAAAARKRAKETHLKKLKDEYEMRAKRDAEGYDLSIANSEAEGKKATAEAVLARQRYEEEYSRIQAAIVRMNDTKKDAHEQEEEDSSSDEGDNDDMSVSGEAALYEDVPAAVTAERINQMLALPEGQQFPPELLQKILDAHHAAAKALAQDKAVATEEAASKAAEADAAAAKAAQKLKDEDAENERLAAEMNGTARPASQSLLRNAGSRIARSRSRSRERGPGDAAEEHPKVTLAKDAAKDEDEEARLLRSKVENDKLKAKQKKERQKLANAQREAHAKAAKTKK